MRSIKKMGSDLREQRGDHDKVPKGVRKGSSSVPHSSLSLLCFGVGSGALLHTNVSWLLAGSPNERQWGQIRGWERGSRNSISYWTGSLVSSFSRVITGLGSGDLCLHLQPGSGSSFLLQLISAVPHCPLVGGSVFPSPVVNPLYLNLESGFYISGWALMGMVGFPGAVIGAASERERKNCLDRESRKYPWKFEKLECGDPRGTDHWQWGASNNVQKRNQVFRYFRELTWLILLSRLVRKRAGLAWSLVNSDSDSGQKPQRLEL